MAFYARRSLATALSRHFSRRLHPSVSHLLPPDHDRSEKPSASSPVPPQTQTALPRTSTSHAFNLSLPVALHFVAHRNISTTSSSSIPDIDAASEILPDVAASSASVSELLSDAATAAASSVPAPPAPYAGEVAAAAADSFAPVAALQHLMDLVHSFTGLNWWACIALTTVLIRLTTVPLLLNVMKSTVKFNALRPEIEAIKEEMQTSTDPRSLELGKQKLGELFLRHGVTPFAPLKGVFIQGPIFMSFLFAITNMAEKVPSLKGGGAYWFTDLTTPDDLFILPVLTSLSFLATVELNMQDGMEGNPMLKTMKNVSRAFGVLFVPLSLPFPKAIFFYWITANLFSLGYGAVIRQPAVRSYLDLPPLKSQQPSCKSLSGVVAQKEYDQGFSDISDCLKKLEERAKSRGESQSISGVDAQKEYEQSVSDIIDLIKALEDRAKSRGESPSISGVDTLKEDLQSVSDISDLIKALEDRAKSRGDSPSISGVDVLKGYLQSFSEINDHIKELEDRAKSRGESQK